MTKTFRKSFTLIFIALLTGNAFAQLSTAKLAYSNSNSIQGRRQTAPSGKPVLWRDPGAVESLDLVGGAAGRQGAPKPPFTFVEESLAGTNPKIKIKDANGVQWTMKFGSEGSAKSKAWRDIWGSGQGIGVVDQVRPAAEYIDLLAEQYTAARARLCG